MNTVLDLDRRHVWHPFTQAQTAPEPILIERGEGPYLITPDGRKLLDLISSWWVNLHGHAHPHIANAIHQQALKLEQVIFAGFTHEPAARLAARLAQQLPAGLNRVFFSDNGSTSIEAALKIALQAWRNRGEQRVRIMALEGGYHGDTFGAMSTGRSSGFYTPFEDKLFEVDFLPFPETWRDDHDLAAKEQASLDALDALLRERGQQTAALILEPLLQGASGMRMCRPEFLNEVVKRVREHDILVIFDEVLTGFYRTGEWWATTHLNVTPDMMCVSKGITGGFLPLGVTACTQELYEAFLGEAFDRAFAHGHSYTANPLACAAALASLELLESPDARRAIQRITETHEQFLSRWHEHPGLSRARALGTIAAVNFRDIGPYGDQTSLKLRSFFLERDIVLRPLGSAVYLLPPYCVTDDQLERAYHAVLDAATMLKGLT